MQYRHHERTKTRRGENRNFEKKFDQFLEAAKEEITALKEEMNVLNDLYNDFIKKPTPAIQSKAEKLEGTFEKINDYNSEISEIETKLQDFEKHVFGKTDKDEDAFKNKLANLKTELEDLHTEWEDNYDALSEKIEGLLPGATSAGLAKSYSDQKQSYKTPNIIWSIVFTLTMAGMVWYAVHTVNESPDLGSAFRNILSRAPFFIPTIWLALFASKQQSQNRRLEQEYAYKESLAKSYDGYKREIEKLPPSEEKDEIMEKLVLSMVEAAGYNPSSTLDKNTHNDTPPLFGNIFNRNQPATKD